MSQIVRGASGKPLLTLPPSLDLTAAAALRDELLSLLALGEGVEIDAGNVQRVTSPCVQVLVSAARSFSEAGGPKMEFLGPSAKFSEAITGLALSAALGFAGDCHE